MPRKTSKEESLFNVDDLGFDPPPSPLEQEEKKRRAKERERQRELIRTQDAHAASAKDLMAEWVLHMQSKGLSETDVPTEIKTRVGRSLRSLIKKGYLHDEIAFALMTFTVRDLRNRKYTPRIGNLEIYARQFRGEGQREQDANDTEQERLRREAITRGQAPSSGTARQNARDASILAIIKGEQEYEARKSWRKRQIDADCPPGRAIEGWQE